MFESEGTGLKAEEPIVLRKLSVDILNKKFKKMVLLNKSEDPSLSLLHCL